MFEMQRNPQRDHEALTARMSYGDMAEVLLQTTADLSEAIEKTIESGDDMDRLEIARSFIVGLAAELGERTRRDETFDSLVGTAVMREISLEELSRKSVPETYDKHETPDPLSAYIIDETVADYRNHIIDTIIYRQDDGESE